MKQLEKRIQQASGNERKALKTAYNRTRKAKAHEKLDRISLYTKVMHKHRHHKQEQEEKRI